MKTRVEFRSNKFPPYPDEGEQMNSGVWRGCLAEYLRDRLEEHGIETKEIYVDDRGWAIPLKHEAFVAWIGCGYHGDSDDCFECFIEPSKPFVKNLFTKIDTTSFVSQVAGVLDGILTSDPEISEVRWLDETEE